MDPLSPIVATISNSLRILEVTYQLKSVGEQTADLLETTRHVDTNLNEARRLRRLKEALLNNSERNWIDGIIDDTVNSLRGVARLIEPARIDKTTSESINLSNRFLWVFRDNAQVRDKHARLSVCHQSLTAAIACLYSKDVVVLSPVSDKKKEEYLPPYDPQLEELFNWRNRRRRRKSFMSLEGGVAHNSMPVGSAPMDSMDATPVSSLPQLRGFTEHGLSLFDPHSASAIALERCHLVPSPIKDTTRESMSTEAAPGGCMSAAPKTSSTDGKMESRTRQTTTSVPVTNSPIEAIENGPADIQSANPCLPSPTSRSEYRTTSPFDLATRASASDAGEPFFSSLELPRFDEKLPNFNSVERDSFKTPSNITHIVESHAPYRQSPLPGKGGYPSTSKTGPNPFLDGSNDLLQKEGGYQHPPFSFSSFAPLTSSHDGSQQIQSRDIDQDSSYESSGHRDCESVYSLSNSDILGDDTIHQDHDPFEGIEVVAQGSSRSLPISPSRVRRGGRSWLMYHASRSDLGHYTG